MSGECDPPDGKWVSIYPNGIRAGEGSYIRIWGECECTEPIIVLDDGNDVICPCGRQYTYVAAHVDVWKETPPSPVIGSRMRYFPCCARHGNCACPPPPTTDGTSIFSATSAISLHDPAGLGWHAAKGGR